MKSTRLNTGKRVLVIVPILAGLLVVAAYSSLTLTASAIQTGQWYFLQIEYNTAGTANMWVDGGLVASASGQSLTGKAQIIQGGNPTTFTPEGFVSYGDDYNANTSLNSVFADGFESGTFSKWTSNGNAAIVQSPVHSGSYGGKATGSNSFWCKIFTVGYDDLFFGAYVQFPTMLPNGHGTLFLYILDGAYAHCVAAGLQVDGNGKVAWVMRVNGNYYVSTGTTPPPTPPPTPTPTPSTQPYGQYTVLKAMFHMHTTFSDGLMTPEQLVDYYANLGYDVIGITDHDTMASFPRAKAEADKMNMILVPGEELTYNWSDGVTLKHVVALFINTTIPWNVNWMNNNLVTPLFDAIHLQGGIGVVAHPWDTAQSLAQWSAFMTPYYARYWIDGWEGWDKSFYLTSGGVYLRDIDFHGTPGEIAANTSASCYTLLMCQNRTLEGVREAFDARRMVIYDGGSYYGSPQALATFIATTDVTRLTL